MKILLFLCIVVFISHTCFTLRNGVFITFFSILFVISISLIAIVIFSLTNSCGIYKPSDARKVPPNSKERVKKNLEEGKGISFEQFRKGSGSGGTSYQFASSNPMWRATLEILDFLPLANVDYSGGIITTDWYNEGTASDESIKITIRFLTNEVRSDGLKVIVHKKRCNTQQKCVVKKISSALENELMVAILKKAIIYEKETVKLKKKKKFKRPELKD